MSAFPQQQHDHTHCINSALNQAQALCQAKGSKLTSQRELVLRLIWQSHQPVGAYDLIDLMSESTGKSIAPPTIYRALEFLLAQGLIHRVDSQNTYVGCPDPGSEHSSCILLCSKCQRASPVHGDGIDWIIEHLGKLEKFQTHNAVIEITGLCSDCQDSSTVESVNEH